MAGDLFRLEKSKQDVYKRQRQQIPSWNATSGYAYDSSGRIRCDDLAGPRTTRKPVSYTHLDVYKRQVYQDPNGNMKESDRFLENGDFVRLRQAQLGYTLSLIHILH